MLGRRVFRLFNPRSSLKVGKRCISGFSDTPNYRFRLFDDDSLTKKLPAKNFFFSSSSSYKLPPGVNESEFLEGSKQDLKVVSKALFERDYDFFENLLGEDIATHLRMRLPSAPEHFQQLLNTNRKGLYISDSILTAESFPNNEPDAIIQTAHLIQKSIDQIFDQVMRQDASLKFQEWAQQKKAFPVRELLQMATDSTLDSRLRANFRFGRFGSEPDVEWRILAFNYFH